MAAVAAINNMGSCAHNPRGNIWFNDDSTFGHKLLMKMGWSKGKGLGKNENGIKENLSVKFRNTNSGLGYKDESYANVMKTEYESILKNLSANYSQNESSGEDKKDLVKKEDKKNEQKSKVVKSKLRYPKLFFGKDVTKYSEKDMKSIFICSLSSENKKEVPDNSSLFPKQEPETKDPKVMQTYSSPLSISDYFAQKMKEKKNTMLPEITTNGLDSEKPSLISDDAENFISSTKTDRKIVKKRKQSSEINFREESVNGQQTELGTEVNSTGDLTGYSRKKSKKKRKRADLSRDFGTTCDEISGPNTKKQRLSEKLACQDEIDEMSESISSCSSDKKGAESITDKIDITPIGGVDNDGKITCQIELSPNKISQLKKKLKKKNKKGLITDVLSVQNSSLANNSSASKPICELSNNIIQSKKKKKRKLKKLKSCLRSKSGNYTVKNVVFSENVSYRIIDTDLEFVRSISGESEPDQELVNQNGITNGNENKNESEENTFAISSANENKNESEEIASISLANENKKESDENVSSDEISLVKENNCESEESVSIHKKVNSTDSNVSNVEKTDAEFKESSLLSSLPSPKSIHYNYWIESQRQALKMKLYKNMLKSIKRHKLLKSTNLLSIKGYGNWGFK